MTAISLPSPETTGAKYFDIAGALAAVAAPEVIIPDVGASIGNHALFFATRMAAEKVVVFEPNPLALAPLVANVPVNRLVTSSTSAILAAACQTATRVGSA